MYNFQTRTLVLTLGLATVYAVASPSDMFTAFTLSSLLSEPDVSVQVLSLDSVLVSAEGNTTEDDFVTKAQVISSGNKEENAAALNTQPEYCPDDYENTPMCKDCGGFTLLYYKELNYYDTRCKGVGDDEDLKDCSCLERRFCEDDDISCELFGPDPDAIMKKAAEVIAQCPKIASDSFADTEFTSLDQSYIDLNDDFWIDGQDDMGQSDDEQEDECLPKESF